MPNKPGVRVVFQNVDTTQTVQEAELPTVILGPLYEVFEKEASSTGFDPLGSATQTYTWPSKRVGTVVDLDGTRNGFIDSQRKVNADMPPSVYLVDGTVETLVDDEDISAISQTGFSLDRDGTRTGLARLTFSGWVLDIDGSELIYKPDGGLSVIKIGDRVAASGDNVDADTVSETQITSSDSLSSSLSSGTKVEEDEGSLHTLAIAPSATSGRIVATVGTTDFVTEVPTIAVGNPVVTGIPMTGLTGLTGAVDAVTTTITGIAFGVSATTADLLDHQVRVVNNTGGQTYFRKVVSVDTVAGSIVLDGSVGSAADVVSDLTIFRGQVGYIESINATNTELTIVVPETFSDTKTFVDIYPTSQSITAYPNFGVKVSYRALRADIADTASSVSSISDFLSEIGHDSADYRDGLGFAMQVGLSAQPENNAMYYVPVDVEPDGSTGLPENRNLTLGYTNALEVIESLDVYNVVLLDRSAAIDSALKSHVDAMSTEGENAYRRGFFVQDVPSGSTDSVTGEILTGQAAGGVVPAASTNGNKVIRDASVNFVTGAGVVAGTIVVITAPAELAGSYTALGTTTDSDLILDGDSWVKILDDLSGYDVKEFTATPVDVNTPSANTHTITAATAIYQHVEADDYVEVTEGGTTYRLKVISVNGAFTEITCTDEVPGSLDFGTGNSGNGTNSSVIRSFKSPAVEYHISPLTRSQKVSKLVSDKSLAGERYTVTLDYAPTMVVGTDGSGADVRAELDPSLTLVAIAAKRSGLPSYQDVTELILGGGIEGVTYAYNAFKKSQLKTLSDAGFCLVEQESASAQPYIRDMITSDTSSGLVSQEEMVVANADWIGKTLSATLGKPIGSKRQNITPKLLGIRTAQLDALLASWRKAERIIDYSILKVEQNAINKRQVDIEVLLILPVAEKEIRVIIQRTV